MAMDGGLSVEWQWQVPEDTAHPVARPRTEGVAGQVMGQVERLLAALSGEMKRDELQSALGLAGRGNFTVQPALVRGSSR